MTISDKLLCLEWASDACVQMAAVHAEISNVEHQELRVKFEAANNGLYFLKAELEQEKQRLAGVMARSMLVGDKIRADNIRHDIPGLDRDYDALEIAIADWFSRIEWNDSQSPAACLEIASKLVRERLV